MTYEAATPKQIDALIKASETLAAYFTADACRVIAEWPDEANIVPYLETLPVKAVRDFDRAIYSIQLSQLNGQCEDEEARRKYEAAMAEQRAAESKENSDANVV